MPDPSFGFLGSADSSLGLQRQDQLSAQVVVQAGGSKDAGEDTQKLAQEAGDAEAGMLSGIERVHTRLFEGRMHARKDFKSNKDIRREWEVSSDFEHAEVLVSTADQVLSTPSQTQEKRIRKERVVSIDGHDVSAETLSKDSPWTAVKTLTSDPKMLASLSNKKREKKKYDHQSFCLNCHDGGEVFACGSCPRVMVSHSLSGFITELELKIQLLAAVALQFCLFRSEQDRAEASIGVPMPSTQLWRSVSLSEKAIRGQHTNDSDEYDRVRQDYCGCWWSSLPMPDLPPELLR